MDIYKLKFTRLQSSIFRLLCIKTGKTLNQREIAGLLKVSPTAVAKALPLIEKEVLLTVKRMGSMNLSSVELRRDNPKAIHMKRAENLRMVYECGLEDILEDEFPGCTIILFGSYSLGEDTVDSDIDIAIIGSKEKNVNMKKYDDLLERRINLHFFSDLKGINRNLKANILNGISLSGVVEL